VTPLFFILWFLTQARSHQPTAFYSIAAVSPLTSKRAIDNLSDCLPARAAAQMTMFSSYADTDAASGRPANELRIRCKTIRGLNNIEPFVPIEAIILQDVVSGAGNVLIPAGSKLIGRGYCDAEAGRFRSRARWTFYVADHQIAVDGTLFDIAGKEGLTGDENVAGADINRIKQAIYRDGIYLYVPADTSFVLSLRNTVSVGDLPSAFENQ
jgi:hypothetical protein